MGRRRFKPEQIIRMLREAEVGLSQGMKVRRTSEGQKLDSCSKQSLCLPRAITMKLAPDHHSLHAMRMENFRLHELHC